LLILLLLLVLLLVLSRLLNPLVLVLQLHNSMPFICCKFSSCRERLVCLLTQG
jgi:hypothetical protein